MHPFQRQRQHTPRGVKPTLQVVLKEGWRLVPKAGVDWTRVDVDPYTESGGAVPVTASAQTTERARIYGAIGPEVSGIRRLGSAALDLAWVAAGRQDGFWEDDLDIWDTAAGVLLVKEAGGTVSDYSGTPGSVWNGEVVAGNENIQGQLLKALRTVR